MKSFKKYLQTPLRIPYTSNIGFGGQGGNIGIFSARLAALDFHPMVTRDAPCKSLYLKSANLDPSSWQAQIYDHCTPLVGPLLQ